MNTDRAGSITGGPLFSIDDYNPSHAYDNVSMRTLLNSPRSLEACRRQGINLGDLDPITEDKVRKIIGKRDKTKRAIPQVLIEIRMKHYEEKRKQMIQLIKNVIDKLFHLKIIYLVQERSNIIDELEKGSKSLTQRGRSNSGSPVINPAAAGHSSNIRYPLGKHEFLHSNFLETYHSIIISMVKQVLLLLSPVAVQ